jgi:hypothetical protein
MKAGSPEKIDFAKKLKDLYTAGTKVKEVTADDAAFLSCEGIGEPGGTSFQEAIQKLYSLAYTVKFLLKHAGRMDFGVGKLECLWPGEDFVNKPKSEWPWELLIRIPNEVREGDLKAAREELVRKRQLDTSAVRLRRWKEGRSVQVMHVGPYDKVGETYGTLDEYAKSKGLATKGPGHEIYISDPRRVASEKLKTIVRLPVS